MRRTVLKEIALTFNNLVRDIGNGLLTLVNGFDQKFPAPDLVAKVILNLLPLPSCDMMSL